MKEFKTLDDYLDNIEDKNGELFGGSVTYIVLATSLSLLSKIVKFKRKSCPDEVETILSINKELVPSIKQQIVLDSTVYATLSSPTEEAKIKHDLALEEIRKLEHYIRSINELLLLTDKIKKTIKSSIVFDYIMVIDYLTCSIKNIQSIIVYEQGF